MKKTILAVAIAALSGSAFALGYNQSTAEVGGSIGSAAVNNGVSGGQFTTEAGAVSISGSKVVTHDCSYCGGGAGMVGAGSLAAGGAYSVTHGETYGNAAGTNSSMATFSAESGGEAEAYGRNLEMDAESASGAAGFAGTRVDLEGYDSGFAAAGTAAGAGSLAGSAGRWSHNEGGYSIREGDTSGLYRDYDLTRVEYVQGNAELMGGSVSGAGSITGGVAVNGDAVAGSAAVTEASTVAEVGAEDAFADGAVSSEAGAVSGGAIEGYGIGVTAAGSYSGAMYQAEANRYGLYTDEYAVEGWVWDLDSEYMGGTDLDINTASASDKKFTGSGAFTVGAGNIVGGSAAGSSATVSGYAEAGDVTSDDD